MKLLSFILIILSNLTYAQNCEKRVKEIFNDLIEGIGNNSIYPPTLEFSDEERSVATMGDYTITVERKVINLFCGQDNFDDKMAYILGHELAHHYLSHSWMANTGLGYSSSIGNYIGENSPMYSKDQRKLSESQADLYAGFYGMISGYNTLANAKQTLESVYKAYKLPKVISGYPSYDERIEIIDSKIDNANDLALVFEMGNILLLNKNYELSKYCYEFILKQFNSREIYNNLGLSYLLYGVSISDESINSLLFPISLDQTTRAKVSATRSGSLTDNPTQMFEVALKQFIKAQSLDSKYQPAKQNLIVAEFLLLGNYKLRVDFIKSRSELDSKLITDLEVINMIIEEKSLKKIKKAAKKGSAISELNILNPQNKATDKDNILKKLSISPIDLLMNKSIRIGNSKLQLLAIDNYQVIEYKNKNLYIIKVPDSLLDNKILSEQDKKNLIKTDRGTYLVYDVN